MRKWITVSAFLIWMAAVQAVYAQAGIGSDYRADAYYLNQYRSSTRIRATPTAPVARGIQGRPLDPPEAFNPPVVKPFSNYSPSPTVSPYLALERDDIDLGLPTYQTFVEPIVQQREFNQQQQRQIQQINRQFEQVQSQVQRAQQSQQPIRPTGHQTYFYNLSHYYQNR